jgi:hypothetical protein
VEEIKVVRQSHIERIRTLVSKWLTDGEFESSDCLQRIAAVLLEPEPIKMQPDIPTGETIQQWAWRVSAQHTQDRQVVWKEGTAGDGTGYLGCAYNEVERLQAEIETLRMQLVACGVVAMSNTPESAAKARDMRPDYMSASCQDVMRAVDSEMALREELARLKARLEIRADYPYDGIDTRDTTIKMLEEKLADYQLVVDSKAARDVFAERRRQVEKEGWTPEHDDEHDGGELARAAACYAYNAGGGHSSGMLFPWDCNWWKPGTPRRDLIKAGALILAEIERLDRAEAMEKTSGLGVIACSDPLSRETVDALRSCNFFGTQPDEHYTAADEARMDVVGQNGNTGEHYAELAELPDGLSWEQAPEWADQLGLTGEAFHVWFNDEQYQYVAQQFPFRFGDHSSFARKRHEVTLVATRPAPAERRDATQA